MYCQWDANDNVMKSEKRVNLHGSMQDTLKKQMTNPTNSIFHYNNPEKAEIIHVYTLIRLSPSTSISHYTTAMPYIATKKKSQLVPRLNFEVIIAL